MGDSSDELEPLFDYRRVQPVFLDLEDSDSSPSSSPKRRKLSKLENKKEENKNGEGKTVEVIDSEDLEEKENWLPPPPKNVAPPSKIHEDSTIKELRSKKLELASLVQSTELALRAAEEASKITFVTPLSSDTEETNEEVPEPAPDRTKIVISIQDKSGSKQYRIFADEKFQQLFKKYAQKVNTDANKLVFSFDGDKIDPALTPQTLGMEDDDIIEVHVKAS